MDEESFALGTTVEKGSRDDDARVESLVAVHLRTRIEA